MVVTNVELRNVHCFSYATYGVAYISDEFGRKVWNSNSPIKDDEVVIIAIDHSTKLPVGIARLNIYNEEADMSDLTTIKPVVDEPYKPFFNHIGCFLLTAVSMICIKSQSCVLGIDLSGGFYHQFLKYCDFFINGTSSVCTFKITDFDKCIPPERFYREKFPELFIHSLLTFHPDHLNKEILNREEVDTNIGNKRKECMDQHNDWKGIDINLPNNSAEYGVLAMRKYCQQQEVNRIENWLQHPNDPKYQWVHLAGKK